MAEPLSQQRFVLRPLHPFDYAKGYIQLLQQLSVVGELSQQDFERRFDEMRRFGDEAFRIAVIEDVEKEQIVASGTLLVEIKFLRQCGKVGHIEDVVVDESVRGHRLGHRIVDFLTISAESAGCYKVILDCSEQNVGFYEKCGYARKDVHMAKYF